MTANERRSANCEPSPMPGGNAVRAAGTAVADSAPGIGPGESLVPRSGEIASVVESALARLEIRWR
jgi:hypothetical protein